MFNYTIIQKFAKNPQIKNAKFGEIVYPLHPLITSLYMEGIYNMQTYPLYEDYTLF
jgi:hypothetical protein